MHDHCKAPGPGFRSLYQVSAGGWRNCGPGSRQTRAAPVRPRRYRLHAAAQGRHVGRCRRALRQLCAEPASDLEAPATSDHSIPSSPTQYLPDPHPSVTRETQAHARAGFWESLSRPSRRRNSWLDDLGSIGFASCKDLTVIEYGCGVGRVTILLAAIAREVVGYDISEPHLQLARQRALALGRTNIRLSRSATCLQPSSRATPFIQRSCCSIIRLRSSGTCCGC